MIKIDFFTAIGIYFSFVLLLVFGRWVFYNYSSKDKATLSAEHLQQCPYCTYLFFDYAEELIKICPRCESYITREGTKPRKSE